MSHTISNLLTVYILSLIPATHPWFILQYIGWIDEICTRITKDLVDMNKPFKYLGTYILITTTLHILRYSLCDIVSCVVVQKNGAGLHLGHSCYWDSSNDNTVIAKWPSEKHKDPNARVICVVSVYGLAY
jgi:dynein light chain Tctex-type 1